MLKGGLLAPSGGKPEARADVARRHPACAKRSETRRGVALRELVAALIEDEAVMMITGLGEPKQPLQEPMDRGRGGEILATYHLRHALRRIVDDDREMIARGRVAALED